MEITCSDGKEEDLYTNKLGDIIGVNIVKDIKMAKVTPKNVCNTFSQSRSRIQST